MKTSIKIAVLSAVMLAAPAVQSGQWGYSNPPMGGTYPKYNSAPGAGYQPFDPSPGAGYQPFDPSPGVRYQPYNQNQYRGSSQSGFPIPNMLPQY